MILCRTLGPVEITVDGSPAPPELLWRKNLGLMVYLARSPRRTRSREHLVAMLWGDRTETAARHSLSEALRVIRRHAGETAVDQSVGQIRLAPESVELDLDRLEQLAGAEDWAGAAELIAGEFLEGFAVPDSSAFEDWLAAERELWRRRSVEVLSRYADALARSGRAQDASEAAARALVIDPGSEPGLRAAVRHRALAGDRTGALELYDRFRAGLAEAGAEPGEETVALVERVRRGRGWQREAQAAYADDPSAARPPLYGREQELKRLLEGTARSAASGRSALLLLEGESGLGKTRLLEEMLGMLRLDGTSVAAARAVQGDRAEAWSGVLALARGGLLEAPGIGAAQPAALAAFADALPDWAERFPGAAPAGWPLGRAFAEVLRAAAEEKPVVLAVDDAQWLDADSSLALGVALRDLASAPLTLVLATAPFPQRAELDELRTRIGRDFEGDAVRLRALDRAALRGLAERMLAGYDPVSLDRVVRRVATDSAGVPLLAVELLQAVALGLDLGTISGAWPQPLRTLDQSLPGDLPDAVVAAIRVSARQLSPAAQQVLLAAAVLGDLTTPDLLERALGLGPQDTARALDELEWHRWLLAEPRGYSFVARIVRQVVERDMVTPGQRRRILEATRGG
ncbi:MAG TPA: AAA family ATPase [Gemmatimonadales bacterium]|nr:AAA family ATPase [Gemmatimonadales bacterium]